MTRMVSQEDRLVQRGANPRTGLVTPFVTADKFKGSPGNGYINIKGHHGMRRHRTNGRWKQDGIGWSLTDSPLPSPAVQGDGEEQHFSRSFNILPDRFVVEMPGVDNPCPP